MKGKAAASAANRRANDANARIAELEKRITELRAQQHSELSNLKTQLAQAQGRLATEIQRLSEHEVNAVVSEAQAAIQQAHNAADERIMAGLTAMQTALQPFGGISLPLYEYPKVAAAFGIETGEMMELAALTAGDRPGRSARRVRNQEIGMMREFDRQKPRIGPIARRKHVE
jgi:hypothetical protein